MCVILVQHFEPQGRCFTNFHYFVFVFWAGLVRDCSLEAVEQQFVAHNGFGVLKKVLQTQGPFKRVVKVAFFLLVMCEKNPKHKGKKEVVCLDCSPALWSA